MAEKHKQKLNEDQIASYLRTIVDRIRTEEDPLMLNEYRRIFRKAVPFTLRAYFAAWLLKELDTGKNIGKPGMPPRAERSGRRDRGDRLDRNERSDRGDRPDRNDRNARGERSERNARQGESASPRGERGERNERGRQQDQRRQEVRAEQAKEPRETREPREPREPRNILPDDVATTLFVSIGRNRRVYPRDLIGLILQNTGIERERIGDIRVLDNYSFVQIVNEDAEKVIASLNEFEYRGRKLAVSFSRKREDAAPSESVADAASDAVPTDETAQGETAREDLHASAAEDSSDYAEDDDVGPGDESPSGEGESDLADDEENNGNV